VSERGKLAIVPLTAVAVAFIVSAVHQRRAHDPDVAHQAVEVFAQPTDDPVIARQQLHTFFEKTTVDWDVKTEVEIACGPDRARDPVACAQRARIVTIEFEKDERWIHKRYTALLIAGIVIGAVAALLALNTWRASRKT
jgi:hypothetical protein